MGTSVGKGPPKEQENTDTGTRNTNSSHGKPLPSPPQYNNLTQEIWTKIFNYWEIDLNDPNRAQDLRELRRFRFINRNARDAIAPMLFHKLTFSKPLERTIEDVNRICESSEIVEFIQTIRIDSSCLYPEDLTMDFLRSTIAESGSLSFNDLDNRFDEDEIVQIGLFFNYMVPSGYVTNDLHWTVTFSIFNTVLESFSPARKEALEEAFIKLLKVCPILSDVRFHLADTFACLPRFNERLHTRFLMWVGRILGSIDMEPAQNSQPGSTGGPKPETTNKKKNKRDTKKKARDSADLAEAGEPEQPGEPGEPTQPSEPVEPAEPVQPGESVEPGASDLKNKNEIIGFVDPRDEPNSDVLSLHLDVVVNPSTDSILARAAESEWFRKLKKLSLHYKPAPHHSITSNDLVSRDRYKRLQWVCRQKFRNLEELSLSIHAASELGLPTSGSGHGLSFPNFNFAMSLARISLSNLKFSTAEPLYNIAKVARYASTRAHRGGAPGRLEYLSLSNISIQYSTKEEHRWKAIFDLIATFTTRPFDRLHISDCCYHHDTDYTEEDEPAFPDLDQVKEEEEKKPKITDDISLFENLILVQDDIDAWKAMKRKLTTGMKKKRPVVITGNPFKMYLDHEGNELVTESYYDAMEQDHSELVNANESALDAPDENDSMMIKEVSISDFGGEFRQYNNQGCGGEEISGNEDNFEVNEEESFIEEADDSDTALGDQELNHPEPASDEDEDHDNEIVTPRSSDFSDLITPPVSDESSPANLPMSNTSEATLATKSTRVDPVSDEEYENSDDAADGDYLPEDEEVEEYGDYEEIAEDNGMDIDQSAKNADSDSKMEG